MYVRAVAILAIVLLAAPGSGGVVRAAAKSGHHQTYKNINDQLDSIRKLQKQQRNMGKNLRNIEFEKYKVLEDEIKFEEKKRKKENELVKRLDKLNGGGPDNAQYVRSRLARDNFDISLLFLGSLFD